MMKFSATIRGFKSRKFSHLNDQLLLFAKLLSTRRTGGAKGGRRGRKVQMERWTIGRLSRTKDRFDGRRSTLKIDRVYCWRRGNLPWIPSSRPLIFKSINTFTTGNNLRFCSADFLTYDLSFTHISVRSIADIKKLRSFWTLPQLTWNVCQDSDCK